MTINVLTIGQSIRIRSGKYRGRAGYITNIRFVADYKHAGYQYVVRVAGIGVRHYGADGLQVSK